MSNKLFKTIGISINVVSCFSSKLAAKLAIKLFSSPQKGKLKDLNNPILKSATQKTLKYQDIQIATYHWKGEKDTILLAHGWESNTSRWLDLIKVLKAEDYNIVSLDAPAHGKSTGKYFNAILFSECIHVVAKKFGVSVVIGHSVGGMASVFFHHKYQLASLKKLVLLGAPSNFTGVFERYSKMMGYNKRVVNAMDQYVLKHYNRLPEYFSAAQFSKEINSKGLIIHDKKDRIIPYYDALDFEKNYTNAKLITTKGFGHGLKSDKIYNLILEFLKT